MDNQTKTLLALAVAGGYVLGRTKRGRLALSAASYLAGKQFGLDPKQLVAEGIRRLGDVPQVAELQEQLRTEGLDVGRKALTAIADRGMNSVAGAIHSRTASIAGGDGGDAAQEAEGEDEEEDDEPEDLDDEEREDDETEEGSDAQQEPEEGEEEEEQERPRRRRRGDQAPSESAPAKQQPGKTAAKKGAPAKKTAPAKRVAPAKKAAKKTSKSTGRRR